MKKFLAVLVLVLMFCNVGVAEDKIDKLINEKNLINQKLSVIKRGITALEDRIKKWKAECIEEEEDLPEEMKSTRCGHIGDPQRDRIRGLSKQQNVLEALLNGIIKEIHFAKIELTQTQQVTESTLSECKETNFHWWTYCKGTYTWSDGDKYVGGWKEGKPHGQGTFTGSDGKKYVGEWHNGNKHGQGTFTWASGDKYVGEWKDDNYHGQGTYTYADGTIDNGIWKNDKLVERNNIGISVAAEPEVVEPTTTSKDTEPPTIEIAEAITVVSQSYTIKGRVRDKSKPIYLEINGRPVEVKNGKFELERFNIDPDVVEELKIVAIDPWNNRSEKLVKVTVELQSTEVVRTYEELRPNRVKVKTDKDKIAIIIGIEKYKNQFECIYCNRDAQAFREYAIRALGVKSSNIKLLVDNKASRGETLEAFKLWLPRIAGDGGKDIYIFFSGHGLASYDGSDLYVLPQDGNSKLLEDTAISRVELISLIQKVNPKSVTMFFDTCYSGQTRDERMLIASLRSILIVADEQEGPDNFTIFSASNFDQVSGSIEEAQQGMFSYYLMKGLEGKADSNQDKQITNGELIAYLKTNVSREAFSQAREQDPMLSGDPNQVLMRYR